MMRGCGDTPATGRLNARRVMERRVMERACKHRGIESAGKKQQVKLNPSTHPTSLVASRHSIPSSLLPTGTLGVNRQGVQTDIIYYNICIAHIAKFINENCCSDRRYSVQISSVQLQNLCFTQSYIEIMTAALTRMV